MTKALKEFVLSVSLILCGNILYTFAPLYMKPVNFILGFSGDFKGNLRDFIELLRQDPKNSRAHITALRARSLKYC